MSERLQTTTLEKEGEREIRAYDWGLDRKKWSEISTQEGQIPPAEYAQIVLDFQRETLINLETDLGERFNAQLFEVYYPLENGRMMHPRQNVPFLDTLIEGQQHRLGENINLNHNQKRELAEVVGFSAVESYFAANTQSGATLINPSPSGGDYSQNLIDIFDWQKKDSQDFVRLRRFAVSSILEEHQKIARDLTSNELNFENGEPADITLKETVIRTSKTADEILKLYIPDQNAMSLEEYESLKIKCRRVHYAYIDKVMSGAAESSLQEDYEDRNRFADIQMGKTVDLTGQITKETVLNENADLLLMHFVLKNQPLREVKTGCGIQGGSIGRSWDLTASSLFNLGSFDSISGQDEYGTLEINCEECGAKYSRTPGKLEEKCRRCGGTKGIVC